MNLPPQADGVLKIIMKSPLISTEDILEQLNCGAYRNMDKRVGTKLRELYKIVRGLDGTVGRNY